MDMENGKKNTIVLTIIAIATLVVAVVGATFAYYSVDTRSTATTTTFTATGSPIGAITLSSPNTTLQMTLTPTDFAKFDTDKKYYALIPSDHNDADTATTNGVYGTSRKYYKIAQADLVGGTEETAYTCTANLQVTLDNADGTMGNVLQSGDAVLYFQTHQTTMEPSEEKLDLSSLVTSGTKTYSIVYKVNGKDANSRQAYIQTDLEITNDADRDQKHLAGKSLGDGQGTAGATLTVTIDSLNLHCEVDQTKAS